MAKPSSALSHSQHEKPARGKSPRRPGKPGRSKSDDSLKGTTGRSGGAPSSGGGGRAAPGRTKSNDSLKGNTPKGRGGDVSLRSERTGGVHSASGYADNVLEHIPHDYLTRPDKAEPMLYYLPKMVTASGMAGVAGAAAGPSPSSSTKQSSSSSSSAKFPNVRVLLAAAEDDLRLHRARQQAGRARDPRLLQTYKIETDTTWLTRQGRLNERELLLGKLDSERAVILRELLEGNTAGLTAKEATAIQLARWQRALELYVYDPVGRADNSNPAGGESSKGTVGGMGQKKQPKNLDFLGLLEKLMETSAEVG